MKYERVETKEESYHDKVGKYRIKARLVNGKVDFAGMYSEDSWTPLVVARGKSDYHNLKDAYQALGLLISLLEDLKPEWSSK